MTSDNLPLIGSLWQHTKGGRYIVVMLANLRQPPKEGYPQTVVYRDVLTGEAFTRPASDWRRSMTEVK